MKKFKYTILLLLIVLTTKLYGDIIIVKPTRAKICTKITNLKEFPDLKVIGVFDCVALSKSKKAFRIKNNSCIKVHKSCPVSLYVVKSDYYKQHDLDEIDWDNNKNVQKLNISIKDKYFKSSDYRSAIVELNLANHKDSIYYLYKSKLIYKYKNRRKDLVKVFKDDVDPFKPISVKTGHAPR